MGPLGFFVDYQMYSGVLIGPQGVMMGSQASCGALTDLTRVLSGPREFSGGLMDSQASCGALTGLTRVLSGPREFLGGLIDS